MTGTVTWHSAQGQCYSVSFLCVSFCPLGSMASIQFLNIYLDYTNDIYSDKLSLQSSGTDFTSSPLRVRIRLSFVSSQSTCRIQTGEMLTLTPLSSTILFHFHLSTPAFVLPTHTSQA